MRNRWKRDTFEASLSIAEATALIQPVFPDVSVSAITRLSGGLSNTNVKVSLSGGKRQLVLRLYQRDGKQAGKEFALSQCLAAHGVPMARYLYLAASNPVTDMPYAIVEWVDGVRLETIVADTPATQLTELARELGQVLARIHGVGFDQAGFLDPELRVNEPIELGGVGLRKYLRRCLLQGLGGSRLGKQLTADLLAFASTDGDRLATWERRVCLVHGDFNGSNILVRQNQKDGWEIAAVLDWEFAFSGAPAFDFGNLLRPPLGDLPMFAIAIAHAYRMSGGELPDDWRQISQIADLYAWADFVSRESPDPSVVADTRRVVAHTLLCCSS